MTGSIVHFEIPYDDGDRARSFYRDTFGWKFDVMPELDYTGVSTGPVGDNGMPAHPGYINGGMYERTPDQPASPVVTIGVDDIDEALKSVEEHGGRTVIPRTPVGEWGYAAYFADTEGNVIGLWQTAQPAA